MYLSKIAIKNYRLLLDAELDIDEKITLLVGRNNTAKTSCLECIEKVISGKSFNYNDYPLSKRKQLQDLTTRFMGKEISYKEFSKSIPKIVVEFTIDYSDDGPEDNLGALSPFIIDVDEETTTAIIRIESRIKMEEETFFNLFEYCFYKNGDFLPDMEEGKIIFKKEFSKIFGKYRNRNAHGYNADLGTARAVKDKVLSDWFYPDHRENKWAQTYIYGAEINFNLGTATKVNMILHGDGSTNIFVKDGLLPFSKYEKATGPNALYGSEQDSRYRNNNGDLDINGQFDLILTNPPFSVELDNDTKKTLKKDFMFGEKKNSENLFVERWYQLLRENGRLAAVLPESVFDTTENKYIRLFLYKYFKIKAVVSLPQLAFEPYTSTKTSILFAQKKTKDEIDRWNELWENASSEWQSLKTRVNNIIAVKDGIKQKSKLPSIKDLAEDEETEIIRKLLKSYLTDRDAKLSLNNLITKYRSEIESLCSFDKDTKDSFGYVNTWWVFGEVASKTDYSVFMAEADNIGYKRSKRGEKNMPNDLFSQDENGKVILDSDSKVTILDYIRELDWD